MVTKSTMPSRLWQEGGGAPNDSFIPYQPQSQVNRANGTNGQVAARETTSVVPTSNIASSGSPSRDNLHGKARRPRSPRSSSAVRDGQKVLAAFRERRGSSCTPESKSAPEQSSEKPARKRTVESLHSPSWLTEPFGQRLGKNQPLPADLARSLDAALKASLHGRRMEEVGTGDKEPTATRGTIFEQENGHDDARSGVEIPGPTCEIDPAKRPNGGADISATDAAAAVAAELSPGSASHSSERPTPEDLPGAFTPHARALIDRTDGGRRLPSSSFFSKMRSPRSATTASALRASAPQDTSTHKILRQAARTSQATFLSSVLPAQGYELDFDRRRPQTSSNWSTTTGRVGHTRGPSNHGSADDPGAATSSDAADQDATTIWGSLQRLQGQSIGLGSAAEHQLGRALELCRDLRGRKGGLGAGSGAPYSEHERASQLEALDSTLRGLEEVLLKRTLIDKAARSEANALGGPATIASMLDGVDATRLAAAVKEEDVVAAAEAPPETPPESAGQEETRAGWLSGAQLRAFAKQIRARSSIEIAALESERRKLRSKVDMFQRQVELLQQEATRPSPTGHARSGEVGGLTGTAARDGLGFANERRFAYLRDARLGEESRIKATLEAEVASLRDALEEKDGLIDALREAVRSSTPPAEEADGAITSIDADNAHGSATIQDDTPREQEEESTTPQHIDESDTPQDAPKSDPRADAVVHGLAVPGRGVFAPIGSRSHGRYHPRPSRLLGAAGPIATARAEAVAARNIEEPPHRVAENPGTPYHDLEEPREENIGSLARRPGDTAALSDGQADECTGADVEGTPETPATPVGETSRPNSGSSAKAEAAVDVCLPEGAGSSRQEPAERNEVENGVVDRATGSTGTALRKFWDSTRTARSKVGLSNKSGKDIGVPRLEGKSSHAVLIL